MFTVTVQREERPGEWVDTPGLQRWFSGYDTAIESMRRQVRLNKVERNRFGTRVYKLRFEVRHEDEWDKVLAVGGAE